MICKTCETIQTSKLRGSGWVELILWLCYLVPGLIYSIWRRSSNRSVCTACGSPALITADLLIGRRLVQRRYPDGIPKPKPPVRGIVHWLTVALVVLLSGALAVAGGIRLWIALF